MSRGIVFGKTVRNIYKINFNTRYRGRLFKKFYNICAMK